MGEAKLSGEKIIFNITPSPGASTCLGNAYADTKFSKTNTSSTKRLSEKISIKFIPHSQRLRSSPLEKGAP